MTDVRMNVYEIDGTFFGSIEYDAHPEREYHSKPGSEPFSGLPCRDFYDYNGSRWRWIEDDTDRQIVFNTHEMRHEMSASIQCRVKQKQKQSRSHRLRASKQ
ncbi:MAG: hypothetical protein ACJ8DI_07245 [Ktedonobacteraceae bacterium]